MLTLATALAVLYLTTCLTLHLRYPELRWDWSKLDLGDLRFPEGFLWGVATAAYQVEGGCTETNWHRFERQQKPDGSPTIAHGDVCEPACEHWTRWPDDLDLCVELGVTSYRFSIEWSKVEPEPGVFDQEVLDHYHQVIDGCLERGLVPMATIHHFSNPLWFEDLGAFEQAENLAHLVRFGKRVFAEYADKVSWWCTFNEIGVYSTMGYALAMFPPGKDDVALCARVIRNMCRAHVELYHALKAMPHGDTARIGLVKNVFQFDPDRRWHLLDWLSARTLDTIYNRAILGVLERGRFALSVPFQVELAEVWPDAKGATDFTGLNYYSHARVRFKPDPKEPATQVIPEDEPATDMPYGEYAEGFYRALVEVGRIGKPALVTENGIADRVDDRRERFIRRYLYAMSRAIADGVDVQGFYYWTLMDNFEWCEGWQMQFGLYHLDRATQERTLREGSRAFVEIVKAHRG